MNLPSHKGHILRIDTTEIDGEVFQAFLWCDTCQENIIQEGNFYRQPEIVKTAIGYIALYREYGSPYPKASEFIPIEESADSILARYGDRLDFSLITVSINKEI